eukprot:scaffold771_cov387-Prasinococcus_capsulatus_cf.AAC.1
MALISIRPRLACQGFVDRGGRPSRGSSCHLCDPAEGQCARRPLCGAGPNTEPFSRGKPTDSIGVQDCGSSYMQ